MNRCMAVAITGILLLSGCAAPGTQGQGQAGDTANRDDPPLGSFIKRKPGSTGTQDASQVDLQALENARNMGNGTIGNGR